MLVPLAIGSLIAASGRSRYAVVGVVFERLLDRDRLRDALAVSGGTARYARGVARSSVALGSVTAASGPLGAALAWWMVRSPSGTDAFAAELGRYTGWSFALVTLPLMLATIAVLRWVLTEVEAAAGVPLDDLLQSQSEAG
jgi:hypothetical protein